MSFKGWPKLYWFLSEHLPKPPREWLPPPRLTDDTPAYVEYTAQQDGSVLGLFTFIAEWARKFEKVQYINKSISRNFIFGIFCIF